MSSSSWPLDAAPVGGRRAPRWTVVLLPITFPLALAAQAVLLLPVTIRDVRLLGRVLAWTVVAVLLIRTSFMGHFGYLTEQGAWSWFWNEARVFTYPRLLDGFMEGRIEHFYVARGTAGTWTVLLVFTLVWASILFLLRCLLRGAQVSLSADGSHPAPLPRPGIVRPTPLGLLSNLALFFIWGCLPALLVLSLPPTVNLPRSSDFHTMMDGPAWVWDRLQPLGYPRLLDPAMEELQRRLPLAELEEVAGRPLKPIEETWWWTGFLQDSEEARRARMPESPEEPAPLHLHWNRYALAIMGLVVLVVALPLTAAAALVWAWRRWLDAVRR